MNEENEWRFPKSNFGERKGISSGDTEAFKKAPYQAFAREILQNSIDARDSNDFPVRVEFHEFEISTNDIPGVEKLKEAIKNCIALWEHKPEYVEEYQQMLDILQQSSITCLRISDFNTNGLVGIETIEQKNNQFLALTKGTGISEKSSGLSGGSKGMGKNAAFLMSSLRTVFYSTISNKDLSNNPGTHFGSIGVAELISGYADESKEDYTQGTGYFGSDDRNNASKETIKLENSLNTRMNNQYGTDIYIIGFKNDRNWKQEVINSILDSFMAAIVLEQLEISVDNNEINNKTIKEIVYDDSIIDKGNKSNFISQYRLLLGGENVRVFEIDTQYGPFNLRILPFSKNEEQLATHSCVMIRCPLMKIREFTFSKNFNVSAMCIIDDNALGKQLRSIENPQHIDWEPKRLNKPNLIKEMKNIIRDIRDQINNKVMECLQLDDLNPLDPNGAGDFLPEEDFDDGSATDEEKPKLSEKVSVSKPKENSYVDKKSNENGENGQGLEPDIGDTDDSEDGDLVHPVGENSKDGDEYHPGKENSGEKAGDKIIFRRSILAGVKYKVLSINKNKGILRVIFYAPIDYENCYLKIALLDDANKSSEVAINSMTRNGIQIFSDDNQEFGPFDIHTNQKISLDINTDQNSYFASEVKVICK